MTVFYFAALANEDGTPTEIDVGGGRDEKTAAKAALRAANEYKQNAVVIGIDSVSGKKAILQTIRYVEGGAVLPEPKPEPELPTGFDRHSVDVEITSAAFGMFLVTWLAKGYTLTLQPPSILPINEDEAAHMIIHATASKRHAE
jgi:hypothetical protein